MDSTTLHLPMAGVVEEEQLPVTSLYAALQDLPDARRAQGKRYSLALVVCLVVLAKLAGQTSLSGASEWVHHRRASLIQQFGVRRRRLPCHTTYYNVLAQVDGRQLDTILSSFFERWEAASVGVERNPAAC